MQGKLIAIVIISVSLSIPLFLVSQQIEDRSAYRQVARMELAQSWTDQQRIIGPVLVVPYRRLVNETATTTGQHAYVSGARRVECVFVVLPEALGATANLKADIRYRGIHEIPVYDGEIALSGSFSMAALDELRLRPGVVEVDEPYLSVAITDMRGIVDTPVIDWSGVSLASEPGSRLPFQRQGFHAALPAPTDDSAESRSFDVSLNIRGMSVLALAPVGESTQVRMSANWPHPNFSGTYPPLERTISDEGFEASWRTTGLATNIATQVEACAMQAQCPELTSNLIRVEMIEPVDIYLQSQRATKYGILFIGLTFGTFLLCEVFRGAMIHPVQYALVGLALSIFYLLLLSLAEHIPFAAAYAIATAACGGLIGVYVKHALQQSRLATLFTLALFGLYGVLYTIIQAEDFALLMGTSLLFAVLAAVMWSTRKVDWFRLTGQAVGADSESVPR